MSYHLSHYYVSDTWNNVMLMSLQKRRQLYYTEKTDVVINQLL